MKVAFVGKGGSGKTTLASLLCRYLAAQDHLVLAIDADINQHLATALGLSAAATAALPPLGLEIDRIKDYLRGSNRRIASAVEMVKTTPPGRGSRLITLGQANLLLEHFVHDAQGVQLMAVGPFAEQDIGTRCYHSKTGAVELLLNHLIDGPREYVVVDMTAGADAFASGLFTRFDVTFLVVEPTLKSLAVHAQYRAYARDLGVTIEVVGNKIEDAVDAAFIAEHLGDRPVAMLGRSALVRASEKGQWLPFASLEAENRAALDAMVAVVDRQRKDWAKYQRQAIACHLRNAASWANQAVGADLALQIDDRFSLAEAAAALLRERDFTEAA